MAVVLAAAWLAPLAVATVGLAVAAEAGWVALGWEVTTVELEAGIRTAPRSHNSPHCTRVSWAACS